MFNSREKLIRELESISSHVRWRAEEILRLSKQYSKGEISDFDYMVSVEEIAWKMIDMVRVYPPR